MTLQFHRIHVLIVTRIYVVLAVLVSFPMLMIWYNKPHDVTTFTPAWAFLVRDSLFVDIPRCIIDLPCPKIFPMVSLFLKFCSGSVTQPSIDAGRCHCVERFAGHGSLPIPRSWRAVHWLLLPRNWFLHDYVLHLYLYSSVCVQFLCVSYSSVLIDRFRQYHDGMSAQSLRR